jgi:hypothetical protein
VRSTAASGATLTLPVPVAGQHAAGQRAVRQHGDALVGAQRDHLTLLLPVEQVVMVLHRAETGPAVAFGHMLGLGELPREHAAGADVAGLARLHHLVQRGHGLLDRRLVVPPVDLVQVDVIGAEPPQRRVDRGEHMLAGQAPVVGALTHREVHLGGQHVVVPPGEEPAQQVSRDLLAHAVRIGVGRVEEGDAALDGRLDDRLGGVLVEMPGAFGLGAVAHHAQADPGNLQPRRAQPDVVHVRSSRC